MTFFIKLEDGSPTGNAIAEQNFLDLFPNTSFPKLFTAESVEPLGFGIYDFSNQPELGRYEVAVEVLPVRNSYGIWRQTWQIEEMNAEQKQAADEKQAEQVRDERNYRLAKSDWTQLPDAPVDAAVWAAYRQALRDVTSQAGFPWDVQWPPIPETDN